MGTGSQTYFHPLGGGSPILFTSVIVVNNCHLMEARSIASGKMQKVIDGAGIAGEWERFVGGIGMVLNAREFKAQLYMDNLSYAMAYSSLESTSESLFSFLHAQLLIFLAGNRTFTGKQSPFTRCADGGGPKSVLACHDIGKLYLIL